MNKVDPNSNIPHESKHLVKSKKIDKGNASVIISALRNAKAIQERKSPEGMIGRKRFFNSPQETNRPQDKQPSIELESQG